jgi:hypothetical protein
MSDQTVSTKPGAVQPATASAITTGTIKWYLRIGTTLVIETDIRGERRLDWTPFSVPGC